VTELGKWIVIAGLVLIAIGGIVWLGGRIGIPLGRLPGDIRIEGEHTRIYMPIVTCLLVSVVLTILIQIARYLFGR